MAARACSAAAAAAGTAAGAAAGTAAGPAPGTAAGTAVQEAPGPQVRPRFARAKREGRSSKAPDAPIMHATYCWETLVLAAALMCPAMPIKPTLTANGCCGRHETVVEDGGRIVWGAAAGAMRAAPNRSMPPPNPHRHQSKVARSWATVALAQQEHKEEG